MITEVEEVLKGKFQIIPDTIMHLREGGIGYYDVSTKSTALLKDYQYGHKLIPLSPNHFIYAPPTSREIPSLRDSSDLYTLDRKGGTVRVKEKIELDISKDFDYYTNKVVALQSPYIAIFLRLKHYLDNGVKKPLLKNKGLHYEEWIYIKNWD